MLNHTGGAFPERDASLHPHGEAVFADLGFGELRLDRRFDLLVLRDCGALGPGRGFSRGLPPVGQALAGGVLVCPGTDC